MTETLLDEGQVHVASHQVRRQRVFEYMRVPLLGRQASSLGNRLEHAKECSPVKPSALLADEKEV
jgi:hypothetical protein